MLAALLAQGDLRAAAKCFLEAQQDTFATARARSGSMPIADTLSAPLLEALHHVDSHKALMAWARRVLCEVASARRSADDALRMARMVAVRPTALFHPHDEVSVFVDRVCGWAQAKSPQPLAHVLHRGIPDAAFGRRAWEVIHRVLRCPPTRSILPESRPVPWRGAS